MMLLGRVIGTVVPCVAYEGLAGVPMLIVQPLDKHRREAGTPIVCCDATRMAGRGEVVYYEGGREAALALDPWFVPVDHSIIGIVDQTSITEPGRPRQVASGPGRPQQATSEPGRPRSRQEGP